MAPLEGRAQVEAGPPAGPVERSRVLQALSGADAFVSLLSDRIDRELLEAGGRLRIVANYAVGYNNMDLAAGDAAGVWLTNTPDVVTSATAECTLALMLAAARRIPESERALREGRFEGWTPTHFLGTLLEGSTLGIVGMGRIGKAVARLARAFGMHVVYCDRERSGEADALGADFKSFDEVLQQSDLVSLHCPLNDQTRHLVDAQALSKMKHGAILVNTSRGPVVDEAALAEALHSGHLGGAGIDVYEDEPRVHPRLLTAPRAVLSAHVGTSTLRTRIAMAQVALGDVVRVLSGQAPLHPVNRPARPRAEGAS
jgi:glyoxylate reductase